MGPLVDNSTSMPHARALNKSSTSPKGHHDPYRAPNDRDSRRGGTCHRVERMRAPAPNPQPAASTAKRPLAPRARASAPFHALPRTGNRLGAPDVSGATRRL